MLTPATTSAKRLLNLMTGIPLEKLDETESAYIVAELIKGCFESLTALAVQDYQHSSDMAERSKVSFQAPLSPPTVTLPMNAPDLGSIPEPKPTVEEPLSDFASEMIGCMTHLVTCLGHISKRFDTDFERNGAAVILVEILGGILKDAHWDSRIRILAIQMLSIHIGWGKTSDIGLTEDRINAYRFLQEAWEDPIFKNTKVWPWNIET